MWSVLLIAATLLSVERGGIELRVEGEAAIDPARSTFLTVTLKAPSRVKALPPDFRSRVRGFSLAEDFEDEPVTAKDGSIVQTVNWKLIPEPCADVYKIAPFVIHASPATPASAAEEGTLSFVAGPVNFTKPGPREVVTGEMECDPQKDLPPLSWKLAGEIALGIAVLGLFVWGLATGVRYLARRVREHRMSPIERAWVELDRLIKRGLPGRGRYKDFYVELTMVVRRYVQRKYGVKAPHLTTEEFLRTITSANDSLYPRPDTLASLKGFLESADLVKFAGVEATPEMADAATDSARGYLKSDNAEVAK